MCHFAKSLSILHPSKRMAMAMDYLCLHITFIHTGSKWVSTRNVSHCRISCSCCRCGYVNHWTDFTMYYISRIIFFFFFFWLAPTSAPAAAPYMGTLLYYCVVSYFLSHIMICPFITISLFFLFAPLSLSRLVLPRDRGSSRLLMCVAVAFLQPFPSIDLVICRYCRLKARKSISALFRPNNNMLKLIHITFSADIQHLSLLIFIPFRHATPRHIVSSWGHHHRRRIAEREKRKGADTIHKRA